MKKDKIEISYNAKCKKWEIKTFHSDILISHYSYAENDGLGFIAQLTNDMQAIRASEHDNLILEGGKK